MDYRKINSHIILMLIGIFFSIVIAGISRFIVLTKGFDTGTANIAFLVVFGFLIIIYLIILSTLAHNIVLLIMKKLPERKKDIPQSVSEDVTDEKENSSQSERQDSQILEENLPIQSFESIRQDSEKRYAERLSAKIRIFQDYAHLAIAPYITDDELSRLDEYIDCYAREESLPKDIILLEPKKLKNPDMFHFGWNMAHHFGFQKQDVVPWLQQVFKQLNGLEPSTIKGKLYNFSKDKYIIPNIEDIPKHLEEIKG